MSKIKIAVVEDEPVVGMDIVANLEHMGYQALGPYDKGEEIIGLIKTDPPDLVLMDINIEGEMDGIEVAGKLMEMLAIPIIFVTASSDVATMARAKKVRPHAYIVKPFNFHNLHSAIELALYNYSMAKSADTIVHNGTMPKTDGYAGHQSIFVRKTNAKVFEKLPLDNILCFEAEGSYTHIVTPENKLTICTNLKRILDKMHIKQFMRIHRSYAINLNHIDEVREDHVLLSGIKVPLGSNYRPELLLRLNIV